MLRIQNLIKRFGDKVAVNDISFSVGPGELYALLGPNGAGKSTTINCLLGFLSPDGGRVEIEGYDCSRQAEETRRRLAYIPEQVNLYPNFTGTENLAYFSELGGHRYPKEALRQFLRDAGLQEEAHERRVGEYSKGMRQKVGIAIAVAKQAKVLLLDEPTSGLDPSAAHEFSELLKALRQSGVAILMATHDLFRARDVATRIGIMRQGRLEQGFSADERTHQEIENLYLETMREVAV